MAKAIHTMIRVGDPDKSIEFYNKAFGLNVSDRFDFDGFAIIYLKNAESDFEIELTYNEGTDEYTHGSGYGHVAVAVDNLNDERTRMAGLGLEPLEIKEFHKDGNLLARFFFVQDPDGYKVEVLEKIGRYA